jgi:hypothetical protein
MDETRTMAPQMTGAMENSPARVDEAAPLLGEEPEPEPVPEVDPPEVTAPSAAPDRVGD